MKKHFQLLAIVLFPVVILFFSCTDDDMPGLKYSIPSTYDFENVSFSGQTQRLNMMGEWKAYMVTAQELGVALDAERMKAMYANEENAQWQGSYEDSKQIKGKTFESFQDEFEALIDKLALASKSMVPGEPGVAGVIESLEGEKSYLIGQDGLDYIQLIEKGLMGACFYYQATAVYFGDERMNVDNEEIIVGKGTTMEHHWDEAFGYFGVPVDFPTNTDGLLFWGDYSNQRNGVLASNNVAMDAFLKGRAAITNKDLDSRDEAIVEARSIWEQIAVGSALHYLNVGMENFEDMALRGHVLSEAVGFIFSLNFNPDKKISNGQINELLEIIAGASDFDAMNLYSTSDSRLLMARDKLAAYYDFEDMKEAF